MDKEALLNKLETLPNDESSGTKEQRLMLAHLILLIEKRDRTRMNIFAQEGYRMAKEGRTLPAEWIEFAFERLAEAAKAAYIEDNPKKRARVVTQAVYLSGRKDPDIFHAEVVEFLLFMEFEFRHKKQE